MILYTKGIFKASNLSHYKNLQKTNVLKLKLLKLGVLIQLIEPLTQKKTDIEIFCLQFTNRTQKNGGFVFCLY